MCYICATYADNTILRAHYAFMAHRNGTSIASLKLAGEGGGDFAGEGEADSGAKLVRRAWMDCCGPLFGTVKFDRLHSIRVLKDTRTK